jgi:hypothetical protein
MRWIRLKNISVRLMIRSYSELNGLFDDPVALCLTPGTDILFILSGEVQNPGNCTPPV